jgi:WD repeat and SOF domain-containing protein 1
MLHEYKADFQIEEIWQTSAHENIVKSLCWTRDKKLLSCAADRTVKIWSPYDQQPGDAPLATIHGLNAFTSLSMHRTQTSFAVASGVISIYDVDRPNSQPDVLQWPNSSDTITKVEWNQVETSILCSAATDRSIVLYDLRTSLPVAKTILNFASNAISWNPMEAFNFAV